LGEEKTATLHDPATTPVIKNIRDEKEVAYAVATVVKAVVDKSIELVQKNKEIIEQKVGPVFQETNGEIPKESAKGDEPGDVQTMCSPTVDSTLRCTKKGWESGLIPVVAESKDETPLP